MSVHLPVFVSLHTCVYVCVCARAIERACERVCAVAARLHLCANRPFAAGAEAAAWPAGEGGTRAAVKRAAPPSPPPRRLCPLNRSPSRLQLISHVTFYLLSPGASCPRTVLHRLRRGAPPQPAAGARAPATLGKATAGRPAALTGPLSTRASGAPGASLGREGGGGGRQRAPATARRPSDPRRAAPRRAREADGVPCARRPERESPPPSGAERARLRTSRREMAARQG